MDYLVIEDWEILTEAEAIDCEVGHGVDTVSVDGDEEVAPM